MVIYNKRKMYAEEVRVIDRAIEIFTAKAYAEDLNKWKVRREKAAKNLQDEKK